MSPLRKKLPKQFWITAPALGSVLIVGILSTSSAEIKFGTNHAKLGEKYLESMPSGNDEYTFHQFYRKIFTHATTKDLTTLQSSENDSVAVQSAWEEVVRTIPPRIEKSLYRPEAKKLKSFLDSLESRIQVRPPEWWHDVVSDTRAHRRDNILTPELHEAQGYKSQKSGFYCPQDESIEIDGDRVIYKSREDSIAIPQELVPTGGRTAISGCFTRTRCFLAIHHATFESPCRVACVDRANGQVLWKSTACGSRWGTIDGIPSPQLISIVTKEDQVCVFGSASGIFAHAFRAADGGTLLRFSSHY